MFLPVKLTTEVLHSVLQTVSSPSLHPKSSNPLQEHKKFGASLWFDTMWKMYEVVEMSDKWGSELPNLFAT